MSNILIINLHQKYEGIANGKLTSAIVNTAQERLESLGNSVKTTVIEEGYNVAEELEKFQWADAFFVQSPVYWMGLPWLGKKYIDEIFSGGNNSVTYANDGRASGGKYGSGGLMKGKKYMLSFTYNCPTSEFDNPDGFFEGLSVDGANVALHKTFQFCGATPLKSFSVHDVYGTLDLDEDLQRLHQILKENFN